MASPLLNPPLEAEVCRRMISAVDEMLRDEEKRLCANVSEREAYLVRMGRIEAFRRAKAEMQGIYDRGFKV